MRSGATGFSVIRLADVGMRALGLEQDPTIDVGSGAYGSTMLEFIREDLGEDPWSKQVEIIEAVERYPMVAVASCHGAGKTRTAAMIAVAWLHTRQPSVVLTTAPSDRQVRHILWREINAIYRRSKVPLLGRPLQTRIEIAPDHYGIGFSSEKPGKDSNEDSTGWQGFHGENILLIPDESAAIDEVIFDGLDAVMSAGDTHALLIGNPTSTSGTFNGAFYRQRKFWHCIKISAEDTPNFAEGRSVDEPDLVQFRIPDHLPRPYLTRPAWANQQIEKRGLHSPYVQARVFANFPTEGTIKLIPLNWIEAAHERRVTEAETQGKRWVAGLDVARFGDDENSLTIRHGFRVIKTWSWMGLDTMQTAGKTQNILADFPPMDDIRVDVIGVGAGVADRLRELGYPVTDINVSAASSDPDEWPNLRHEGWWQLRERFRENRIAGPIDEDAQGQLSDLEYGYKSGYTGAIIEAKERTKKRTRQSPDRAEGIMLAFIDPPRTGTAGSFRQTVAESSGWTSDRYGRGRRVQGNGNRPMSRLRRAYEEARDDTE